MWFRITVAVTFSLLGFFAVLRGTALGSNDESGAVWLNLGTEVMGIAITVAIVDWLFEWRRKQEEGRGLARRMLSQLDYTVWVWQGGRRDSSVYELNALLRMIGDSDPIADCTAELIFTLGCEAQTALEWQEEIVRANRELRRGLADLKPLIAMRDPDPRLTVPRIRTQLQSAAAHLARAARLDYSWASSRPQNRFRNPSEDHQFRRRFGEALPENV